MDKIDFKINKEKLLDLANEIMSKKQPEYTNDNENVFQNFISTAENLNLQPMEVWAVFFHKHVQSILSHAHNPDMNQAEPIETRYADAINYLFLGYAMIIESKKNEQVF